MVSKELAEQQFSKLMEHYKCTGQYRMLWKTSPNRLVEQITVQNLKSGTSHSFSARNSPESPKYWLNVLKRALIDGTF